jgi:hypothetical protein
MKKSLALIAGLAMMSSTTAFADDLCEQCGSAPPPPPPSTSSGPVTSPKPPSFPGQVSGFPNVGSKDGCSTGRKSRGGCKSRADNGNERFAKDSQKTSGNNRNTRTTRKSRR